MAQFQSIAFGVPWLSDEPLSPFAASTASMPGAPVDPIVVSSLPTPATEREILASRANVQFALGGFRYNAQPQATIDVWRPGTIHVHAGPEYRGTPPPALFSTVTALVLADRGLLPMHGSAVVEDGRVTLICGKAGMGKSTLTARLLTRGATLLSDDLSVLHLNQDGTPPLLYAGRRALRLHPGAAATLEREVICCAASHPADGKTAVYPPQADPHRGYPLARVLLLGEPATIPAAAATSLLVRHFFRPACLRLLENHERRIGLFAIAIRSVEIMGVPAL